MRDWGHMIREPFSRDGDGVGFFARFRFPTAVELRAFEKTLRCLLPCDSHFAISQEPWVIEVDWEGKPEKSDAIEWMYEWHQQTYRRTEALEARWAETQFPPQRSNRSSRVRGAHSFLRAVGFLVPRRSRQALIGDLVEDVAEQRAAGYGEWRIRCTVCWQLFFAMRLHIAGLAAWTIAAVQKLISG